MSEEIITGIINVEEADQILDTVFVDEIAQNSDYDYAVKCDVHLDINLDEMRIESYIFSDENTTQQDLANWDNKPCDIEIDEQMLEELKTKGVVA